MNGNDRQRLYRLSQALQVVPFGQKFSASRTTGGVVGFEEDWRQLRPALAHLLDAMIRQGFDPEFGLGMSDYAPELWLDAIERWAAARSADQWASAGCLSFLRPISDFLVT